MNLTTTSSPHIRGKDSTSVIMRDVILAMLPTLAMGTYLFGLRALALTLVSVVAALASEFLFRKATGKSNTLPDCSAIVTGMLLAFTLPATVPYWMAAVGSAFAIIVVKGLSGGLGHNIFNPALAARAFLLLLWPVWLVRYTSPGADLNLIGTTVDIVTTSTPLHHMVMPALPEATILEMLVGNIGGTIAEVSTVALLLGGIYLVVRKVISPRIPLVYLSTVAALTLIFFEGESPLLWMLYSLLGGGVMLGALFMATDYATSPVTPNGQIFYGIGCGVLTVLFRNVGLYPEGVTYAILLMNATVWLLDQITPPRRFGVGKGGAQ